MSFFIDKDTLFQSYPELVKVSDVQKMLNVGKNSAYRIVKTQLTFCLIDNGFRIAKQSVIDYVLRQVIPNNSEYTIDKTEQE